MLEVGSNIRYRGLGAGRVLRHVVRPFSGQDRIFAVIYFDHSSLEAQIPVGDPAIAEKIEPVLAASTLAKILRSLQSGGDRLHRTWDARQEAGESALREGGPRDWAGLLASYARAEGAGVPVAASDEELVRQAQEMFAAELACAKECPYEDALQTVAEAYARAIEKEALSGSERADNYSAIS